MLRAVLTSNVRIKLHTFHSSYTSRQILGIFSEGVDIGHERDVCGISMVRAKLMPCYPRKWTLFDS